MKIHREGYKILFYSAVSLAILNILIIYLFSDCRGLWITLLTLSVLILILLLAFFRKPERKLVEDAGKIYSAADGRVVAIEVTDEDEYFRDRRLQVSVFMTLFNVHYNTYPVSGTVKYVRHHPGKFYPANHPKSSNLNERLSVVVETEDGVEIMIRQVAGLIARRIVSNAKTGLKVKQGDELGFIKFGSRVDIFLPADASLNVNLLQAVRANRDILAKI
jgi:phosphatidylserine decarboxylase